MKIIDSLSFDDPSAKDDLIAFIRQQINTSGKGYCIVENNVTDANAFMLLLHECIGPSLSMSQKNGIQIPYDVVKDRGHDMGNEGSLLSSTNQVFPLHTDCCFLDKPADFIALYCVENSASGGESILLNINEVIHLLSDSTIQHFLTTSYQFFSKKYRILEKMENLFFIRFHQGELVDSCLPADKEACLSGIQPLLQLLNDPIHYTTVKLKADQCLIVNNRTCLHGRYAFEAGSKRAFYRSRHYL
ncbi:hypothetical protein FAM09_01365 [Niastella caeni]|uniref:TauD/TfdA-like domain-containing protein n=1 Tax=Niastella caeni TaxID=2569763 RepID=A0A4S8I0S8_9BACT|nr:TauD/TfdA family dioxygenase [Niastella caeni]THU40789.1 hypothetical protein FAM09_01365 [Niastella caeni]